MWPRAFLVLTALVAGGVVGGAEARLSAESPPLLLRVQQELLTPDQVLALMNSGQLDEAERAARAAMKARPDSARSRLVLARILARKGDLVQARAMLKQAKALPQWKSQNLGVPYPTPDALDKLVRTDPAKSLGVLADVLLALGDDPKAYFLQARAYGELGQWQKGRNALQRARALNPSMDFANPSVLAALEKALAEEIAVPQATPDSQGGTVSSEEPRDTSLSDVKFDSSGNVVIAQETPWWQRPWVWLTTGILSALAGWLTVNLTRWKRQRELKFQQTLAPLNLKLEREIQATEQKLSMNEDAETRRKLERLRNLQGQMGVWIADPFSYEPLDIELQFNRLWLASRSDANYAAYEQKEAQRAARVASETDERRASMPSSSESSFSSDSGSSWSDGSSSSSTDNSGGSSW